VVRGAWCVVRGAELYPNVFHTQSIAEKYNNVKKNPQKK
jgi:hypothetical protein